MANFWEMSGVKQWAVVLLGATALVTVGLYYTVFEDRSATRTAAGSARA